MAPSKRRRADAQDDDEDEVTNVQTARSDLRQSHNKRPRLSLAQENGGSVVSDEDEEIYEDGGEDGGAQLNEADFNSDGEEAEVDNLRKSKYVLQQLQNEQDNIAVEHGIIEEVFCRNFMCHSKLRIKLGPLINFIIGHNGSGKSAVLTALTLCLGVKATATNRGASLKKFIKEGEESAMLAVKIKNQGEMAYQHDVYGDSITVERHFTKAGSSQFKIKNANDKVVTTKRGDLEDMLDYLALQLDNPMNVLSQDLARQFLSNSTPRDKYKFFLKGTQLEQLDRDYRMIEEALDNTETKLYNREDDIAVLAQKADEAGAKKKAMDDAQNIREKIAHLQWMYIWAQVEVIENDLAAKKDDVEKAEVKIQEKITDFEQKSESFDQKHQAHEAAEAQKQQVESDLAPHKEKQVVVKEKFDDNKKQLQDEIAIQRRIKSDIDNAKGEIQRLEGLIEQEQDRIEQANGPAQARRLADLEEAKATLKERRQQKDDMDKTPLIRAREGAEGEVNRRKGLIPQQQAAVQRAEAALNSLRNTQNQRFAGYRPKLEELLRVIDNSTHFRQKPVGPMGLHMRLLKPEWSSILEKTFGGNLEAFVVTNKEDQAALSRLQHSIGYTSAILIGDPRPIDTTGQEPTTEVDTILRVLEVDNDLVRNQIIINQMAEKTVLIADRREANDFMFGNSSHNTRATLTQLPSGWGQRMERTGGGQKTSSIQKFQGRARMTTDVQAQIQQQNDQIAQEKRQLDAARQSVREAEMELKNASQAVARFDRELRERKIAFQDTEARIEDLRSAIDGDRIEAGMLDTLNEQLRDSRETEATHVSSYQDAVLQKDRINDAQKIVKAELDAATREVAEAEAKLAKAEKRLARTAPARQQALQEKNLAQDFIDVARNAKTEAEGREQEVSTELAGVIVQADQVHRRVQVEQGMTVDLIDNRIKKIEQEYKRATDRIGGSREDVMRAYHDARHELSEAQKGLKSLKTLSTTMKRSLVSRKYRWKAFRQYITARAKFMFTYLLSERAFRGHIIVNHAEMAMDISVEPDIAKSSDKGRQTKTLSGGEKSFSTICLLLSIWEAMGSPIRCLDEFDVFMDNVNRDISMKMMIGAARRSVGRQFILITPQSMNNVDTGGDVKIHKMSDPERGQTTLSFG